MTKLSVNINKFATLRNARGGNNPDILKIAVDCQRFGAQGITIHPRPDQRHIRFQDVMDIIPLINTEYNIEGYPTVNFIEMVLKVKPDQVTLVPDTPDTLTSNKGWDTIKNESLLTEVIKEFKKNNIRTSIFIETDSHLFEPAAKTGTDRVELYTEEYSNEFDKKNFSVINKFLKAAELAKKLGMDINAGHDLNLRNLKYFIQHIPFISEVSIGHALVCDALYFGLENTIQMYLRELDKGNS